MFNLNSTILVATPPRDEEDAIRRKIEFMSTNDFYKYPDNKDDLVMELLEDQKEWKSIYYVNGGK